MQPGQVPVTVQFVQLGLQVLEYRVDVASAIKSSNGVFLTGDRGAYLNRAVIACEWEPAACLLSPVLQAAWSYGRSEGHWHTPTIPLYFKFDDAPQGCFVIKTRPPMGGVPGSAGGWLTRWMVSQRGGGEV